MEMRDERLQPGGRREGVPAEGGKSLGNNKQEAERISTASERKILVGENILLGLQRASSHLRHSSNDKEDTYARLPNPRVRSSRPNSAKEAMGEEAGVNEVKSLGEEAK